MKQGKSITVNVRLHEDSPAGKIYQKWFDSGTAPRLIIESALLAIEGREPPPADNLSEATLALLQSSIDRLESIALTFRQNGGTITPSMAAELGEALNPAFVQNMRKGVRPGFTRKG